MDAYVGVHIPLSSGTTFKDKTKVERSPNPVWNHRFNFKNVNIGKTLQIQL